MSLLEITPICRKILINFLSTVGQGGLRAVSAEHVGFYGRPRAFGFIDSLSLYTTISLSLNKSKKLVYQFLPFHIKKKLTRYSSLTIKLA